MLFSQMIVNILAIEVQFWIGMASTRGITVEAYRKVMFCLQSKFTPVFKWSIKSSVFQSSGGRNFFFAFPVRFFCVLLDFFPPGCYTASGFVGSTVLYAEGGVFHDWSSSDHCLWLPQFPKLPCSHFTRCESCLPQHLTKSRKRKTPAFVSRLLLAAFCFKNGLFWRSRRDSNARRSA